MAQDSITHLYDDALIASAEFVRDLLLNDDIPMTYIQIASHKALSYIKGHDRIDELESRLKDFMREYPVSALYFSPVLEKINKTRIETYTDQLHAFTLLS